MRNTQFNIFFFKNDLIRKQRQLEFDLRQEKKLRTLDSNKRGELEDFIKLSNIDLAFKCETLPKNNPDLLANEIYVSIQGHNHFESNQDRGVCIIYKESPEITEKNLKQM